jgi:hypothetical protein
MEDSGVWVNTMAITAIILIAIIIRKSTLRSSQLIHGGDRKTSEMDQV